GSCQKPAPTLRLDPPKSFHASPNFWRAARGRGDIALVASSRSPTSDTGSALWAHLLDHLVGSYQQCLWDRQTDCLRGLQVDDQLELRRLLHGEIGRIRTLDDDPINVGSRASVHVSIVRAERDQRPLSGHWWPGDDGRQAVVHRSVD